MTAIDDQEITDMSSKFFAYASGLLLVAAVTGAQADELPMRKAGWWEMKMDTSVGGTAIPESTIRQCTDEALEKEMRDQSIKTCSKRDVKKTATGYVVDTVCKAGAEKDLTTHTEITGDFSTSYTMTTKQTGRPEGAMIVTGTVKRLGACPSDWKPGDTEMPPGGTRTNIKDRISEAKE